MARLNDSRIAALLADDFAVRASTRTTASRHAAHGVALFITIEHDVQVVAAGQVVRGRAVLVPADSEHALHSPGPTIGICFDPERQPRVTALARAAGGPIVIDGRAGARLVGAAQSHRSSLDRADVLAGIATEAARLVAAGSPIRIDSRVAQVVEALRDPTAEIPQLAISNAHLQELFTRDVGTPMRSYRLWRRLMDALVAFTRVDATTAAHAAGFADLAHFSRTCRRMLGYSPTLLRDGV